MTQSPPKTQERPTPAEEVRRLYDEAEARMAEAFDEVVSRPSFGEVLARLTENVVALTRIGNDTLDLVVRNLRVAGRRDLIRVERQISRTEDKLEMVLQEVERVRDEMRQRRADGAPAGAATQRSESGRTGAAEADAVSSDTRKGAKA
jgi:hypothetical protein